MESRYIVLNVFDLSEFMSEVRRLGIDFVYLAKVEERIPVKLSGGYSIPHSNQWVLASAFSFNQGLFLKLKGAYSSIDISFAKTWTGKDIQKETEDPNQQRYEEARKKVFDTYDKWHNQLKEWFYVGYGILSLTEEKGVLGHDTPQDKH